MLSTTNIEPAYLRIDNFEQNASKQNDQKYNVMKRNKLVSHYANTTPTIHQNKNRKQSTKSPSTKIKLVQNYNYYYYFFFATLSSLMHKNQNAKRIRPYNALPALAFA